MVRPVPTEEAKNAWVLPWQSAPSVENRTMETCHRRLWPSITSVTALLKFCIASSTRVDPAGFLHKRLQPRLGFLAVSDIPQCPRPFADCLDIDFIATRAANDGSIWICVSVK